MKKIHSLLLLATALLLAAPAASAQDAAQKARLATIREAYTSAMELAKKNQAEQTRNTQVFQSVQTDPNGVWKRKLEFVCNLDYLEELDLYTPDVVFIRQDNGGYLQEFLFDKEGVLMFVFERSDPGEDDETVEYRYYYDDEGVPFWKIEKQINAKTKKTLSTKQEPVEEADGSAFFLTRVANDLKTAFYALNVMYD